MSDLMSIAQCLARARGSLDKYFEITETLARPGSLEDQLWAQQSSSTIEALTRRKIYWMCIKGSKTLNTLASRREKFCQSSSSNAIAELSQYQDTGIHNDMSFGEPPQGDGNNNKDKEHMNDNDERNFEDDDENYNDDESILSSQQQGLKRQDTHLPPLPRLTFVDDRLSVEGFAAVQAYVENSGALGKNCSVSLGDHGLRDHLKLNVSFIYEDSPFRGWQREASMRMKGKTKGSVSMYYRSPEDGKRFRNQIALSEYLKRTSSSIGNYSSSSSSSSNSSSSISSSLLDRFVFGSVYCVCHSRHDENRNWLECSLGLAGCQGWVHPECVGLGARTETEIRLMPSRLLCPLCTYYLEGTDQLQEFPREDMMILRDITIAGNNVGEEDNGEEEEEDWGARATTTTTAGIETTHIPHVLYGWQETPFVYCMETNKSGMDNSKWLRDSRRYLADFKYSSSNNSSPHRLPRISEIVTTVTGSPSKYDRMAENSGSSSSTRSTALSSELNALATTAATIGSNPSKLVQEQKQAQKQEQEQKHEQEQEQSRYPQRQDESHNSPGGGKDVAEKIFQHRIFDSFFAAPSLDPQTEQIGTGNSSSMAVDGDGSNITQSVLLKRSHAERTSSPIMNDVEADADTNRMDISSDSGDSLEELSDDEEEEEEEEVDPNGVPPAYPRSMPLRNRIRKAFFPAAAAAAAQMSAAEASPSTADSAENEQRSLLQRMRSVRVRVEGGWMLPAATPTEDTPSYSRSTPRYRKKQRKTSSSSSSSSASVGHQGEGEIDGGFGHEGRNDDDNELSAAQIEAKVLEKAAALTDVMTLSKRYKNELVEVAVNLPHISMHRRNNHKSVADHNGLANLAPTITSATTNSCAASEATNIAPNVTGNHIDPQLAEMLRENYYFKPTLSFLPVEDGGLRYATVCTAPVPRSLQALCTSTLMCAFCMSFYHNHDKLKRQNDRSNNNSSRTVDSLNNLQQSLNQIVTTGTKSRSKKKNKKSTTQSPAEKPVDHTKYCDPEEDRYDLAQVQCGAVSFWVHKQCSYAVLGLSSRSSSNSSNFGIDRRHDSESTSSNVADVHVPRESDPAAADGITMGSIYEYESGYNAECDLCGRSGGIMQFFRISSQRSSIAAPSGENDGWLAHLPCLHFLRQSHLLQPLPPLFTAVPHNNTSTGTTYPLTTAFQENMFSSTVQQKQQVDISTCSVRDHDSGVEPEIVVLTATVAAAAAAAVAGLTESNSAGGEGGGGGEREDEDGEQQQDQETNKRIVEAEEEEAEEKEDAEYTIAQQQQQQQQPEQERKLHAMVKLSEKSKPSQLPLLTQGLLHPGPMRSQFDRQLGHWRCSLCGIQCGIALRCMASGCVVRAHMLCVSIAADTAAMTDTTSAAAAGAAAGAVDTAAADIAADFAAEWRICCVETAQTAWTAAGETALAGVDAAPDPTDTSNTSRTSNTSNKGVPPVHHARTIHDDSKPSYRHTLGFLCPLHSAAIGPFEC